MAEIWYTSDTHWNHLSMVEKKWRDFGTIAEMNEHMVTRWNENVRPDDHVWHLGDWGLGNVLHHIGLVHTLHGHIHLVPGNHDRVHPAHRDSYRWQKTFFDAGFESIQAFARRRIAGQSVLLSHFPYDGDNHDHNRYSQYRLRDEGDWLLHGHVHELWDVMGRQINVGVDVRNFTPVPQPVIEKVMFEQAVEADDSD